MSVALDATVGGSASNCYCTYAEATTYHDTRGQNSTWLDNSQPDCEKALMWATRLMDQLGWRGRKNVLDQALRWPRVGCVDREGFPVSYTDIPQVVKEACAEWAMYLLIEDRTLDEGGLTEVGGKVGPITNPDSYYRKVMPDGVRDMLNHLITYTEGFGKVFRV